MRPQNSEPHAYSFKWVNLIIMFLCFCAYGNAQGVISPTLPENEPSLVYRDAKVLFRFAYKDLIRELNLIKEGEWFAQLDSASKEKFENTIRGLKSNEINYLDVTASVMYEPLLVKIIQESLGATLLSKERALIWRRQPLESISKITYEKTEGNKWSFYWGGAEPFFTGLVMEKSPTSADFSRIDLTTTKNDSLLIAIRKSAIENHQASAQYPGGDEKLMEFIYENFSCSGHHGFGIVQMTIDSSGFIDENSIKFLNSFPQSCREKFIRVLLKTKQWKPAYSTVGQKSIAFRVNLLIDFKKTN